MTIDNVKYTSPVTGSSSSLPTIIEGSVEQGADNTLLTADMTVRDLLERILIELKIMNLRNEVVTGEQINEGDL